MPEKSLFSHGRKQSVSLEESRFSVGEQNGAAGGRGSSKTQRKINKFSLETRTALFCTGKLRI